MISLLHFGAGYCRRNWNCSVSHSMQFWWWDRSTPLNSVPWFRKPIRSDFHTHRCAPREPLSLSFPFFKLAKYLSQRMVPKISRALNLARFNPLPTAAFEGKLWGLLFKDFFPVVMMLLKYYTIICYIALIIKLPELQLIMLHLVRFLGHLDSFYFTVVSVWSMWFYFSEDG